MELGGTFDPWFVVAVAATVAAHAPYLLGLRRHLVRPNRVSWLIWSATAAAEAATYAAVNQGVLQSWVFFASAAACVAVTVVLWRSASWERPEPGEIWCLAASIAALVLWLAFREAFWAHMLLVAAVPVSFWPTWASVWQDRNRERSPAWGLWTVGDLATLLVATRGGHQDVGEYAYVVVELLCHASVWFMVGLATINPWRSLGFSAGGLRVLDRYRPAANLFAVGETHLGKAVFAADGFAGGERIVRFTGRRFRADRVPSLLQGASDRFVQVTPNHYMGPSGRIDDLINHSCAPNSGLRFGADGVFLVAIRDIAPGEEIAWDYSTTLKDSNWHMICQCRAPDCRRVIADFATLPEERQEWFRSHNLVAPYLRRRDDVGSQDRAA